MDDVVREKDRNTKTRAVNSQTLIYFEIFQLPEAQDRTDLAGLDHLLKVVGKSFRSCDHTRPWSELAHLAEFFPEGHLCKKIVSEFLRFGLRSTATRHQKDDGCDE